MVVKFQLQPGRWRRPLSMGYQTSETHEEFRAQPGISEPHDPPHKPQGFLIDGHQNSGPSQVFFHF